VSFTFTLFHIFTNVEFMFVINTSTLYYSFSFFTAGSRPIFSQVLPTTDCWYLTPGLLSRTLDCMYGFYAHRFVLFTFIARQFFECKLNTCISYRIYFSSLRRNPGDLKKGDTVDYFA